MGAEADLVDELGDDIAEQIGEGVVLASERPRDAHGDPYNPAFARQAMETNADRGDLEVELLADRLARVIKRRLPKKAKPWRWHLQIVAPDSRDPKDPRRAWVKYAQSELPEALRARLPPAVREREAEAPDEAERLVQIWAVDDTGCLFGVTQVERTLSIQPAGRIRLRREDDSPSRSGLKLEEAIHWIGMGPAKGDVCVDLGAAPGGWSQVAVKRGAAVLAIDPARIKVSLPKKKFEHLQASAFDYVAERTFDWLLCDMAWRPLEVAKLLAKWARRGWAAQLLCNIKLPMKQKAEMLQKVRAILESAGWQAIRARQLIYDRDEVTFFAYLDPKLLRRGPQAPFRLKSRGKKGGRARGQSAPRGRSRPRKKRRRSTTKNR